MSEYYIADQKFEKLNYTVMSLYKGEYEHCKFINCDFSNSDLSGVKFVDCEFITCNLSLTSLNKTCLIDIHFKDCKASFGRTILEKADLKTAYHYAIDPENNRIKKAKFSLSGLAGLLYKYDILIS